jgi:hypothetical protein
LYLVLFEQQKTGKLGELRDTTASIAKGLVDRSRIKALRRIACLEAHPDGDWVRFSKVFAFAPGLTGGNSARS